MRYIDADKLCKGLKEMANVLAPFKQSTILGVVSSIENFPTANVVPKSEVAELKAIIADHKASEERMEKLYSDAKAEVKLDFTEEEIMRSLREVGIEVSDKSISEIKVEYARKIFAEIETCMKNFEDDDDGYLLKKCEFEFFMRELKKGYAEDKE